MITQYTCTYCHNTFIIGAFAFCPHCARPSLYPNVNDASRDDESLALKYRYDQANSDAVIRGVESTVEQFERRVNGSEAVISRSIWELNRLASSDYEISSTYWQAVQAETRVPANDKWNKIRAIYEESLFPGYKEHITFACLTLTGYGIPHYGDCSFVFREDMIAHRTSVFEENCIYWHTHHDVNPGSDTLPAGYRATWENRHELAVAKLASKLTAQTCSEEFATLLMNPRSPVPNANTEEDDFIEVHIWGSWTIRTLARVTVSGYQPENPIIKAIESKLAAINIGMEYKK